MSYRYTRFRGSLFLTRPEPVIPAWRSGDRSRPPKPFGPYPAQKPQAVSRDGRCRPVLLISSNFSMAHTRRRFFNDASAWPAQFTQTSHLPLDLALVPASDTILYLNADNVSGMRKESTKRDHLCADLSIVARPGLETP